MTKSELIERINNIPLDLLHSATVCIINSNPNNAILANHAYYREYCGQIVEMRFKTRATKENIINVYNALLDEIAVRIGIENVHREIDADYAPEWATETKEETETMNATETKTAFPHIRAEIERKHAERIKNTRYYIEYGFFPTWAEEHRTTPDRGLKEYSTPAKWEAYTAGKITREKAIECAAKRAEREAAKTTAAELAKVESAENAADLISIEIDIVWKRSATWGYNPTAEITTRSENGYHNFTGTASGCGYDKLTAAVGSALNQSPEVLKMLYTVQEKAFSEMDENARAAWKKQNESNRDTIHYGAGYGILPYFEGGTGWSSFAGVFEKCGYTVTHHHSTKHSDYYFITAKEEENA